jgi:methenyltetrahydrofolate cyclohydrolase
MTGRASVELSTLPLAELVERVAARTPAPGGGSGAGIACALAAALVEMAAGFDDTAQAGERGAEAAQLRARALELAQQDLTSYAPVLEALRRPAGDAGRAAELEAALVAAATVPLGIARAAAEVARLARAQTEAGNRNLRGDSATAALLAQAACHAGGLLVDINLHGTADPRLAEVDELARNTDVDSQHAVHRARER